MKRSATTLPYTEFPVAFGNFDTNRNPIDMIVLHTEVGFKTGTEATFDNLQSHISAHYGVNQDGTIDHFLEEYNTAYHAGDYSVNLRSIGIEHEDLNKPNDPRPDALYETSSKLVADICKFYNISCDRDHIKKHNEVLSSTQCPDSLDVDRIVFGASQILNPSAPQPVINDQSKYDFGAPYGILEMQAVRSQLQAKDQALSQDDTIINNYNIKVTALQKDVENVKQQLTTCENRPPQVIEHTHYQTETIGEWFKRRFNLK